MRITKDILEAKVKELNRLCSLHKIKKEYEIGYRYSAAYLDEKSLTNPGCIVRSIASGTKTEVASHIDFICSILH